MTLAATLRGTFADDGAAFEIDATIEVPTADTLVVLGPSGSGKTLLLELLAGLHGNRGTVTLDGVDLTRRPPERRGFGFVFQDHALFPHMTARENVAFGARYHDDARDPQAVLASVGAADLADRSPATLSGGERQRVALARALTVRPDVLLLDEPLASLDVPTRQALRADLAALLEGVNAVYVTHDRTTARALGDSVAVMRDGGLVQRGPPGEVFARPASAFVARFVGANVLPGPLLGRDGAVAVRPEHVVLGGASPSLSATVERVVREDASTRVTLDADGTAIEALTDDPPAVGETVGVVVPESRLAPLG